MRGARDAGPEPQARTDLAMIAASHDGDGSAQQRK